MGNRQSLAKRAELATNNPRNPAEFLEGQIPLTAFDSANKASVNVGFEGEVFLRKPSGFPRHPNPLAEYLERSLFQP